MAALLLKVSISLLIPLASYGHHPCLRKCIAGHSMQCHYNFTIEWYHTLSKACYDCPFNITDCYRPECIAADGKRRAVIAINRQVPGPSVHVCEGDEVIVSVQNMLEDGLATTIHWHGQHMLGTPYMDGVGQVTQCHIQHQETFVYHFMASPAGTHWYHAHTGMQTADGLFGPLIVHQPAGADPSDNLYDQDLPEHVFTVYDWSSELSMATYMSVMHDVFDVTLPRSILVNGRGQGYNVTDKYGIIKTNLTHAQTPLEVVHVQKGSRYRLRFIGASSVCPLQVSIDNHQLIVIAVDGQPLDPRPLDTFIINPGERYDFVLNADEVPGCYWIRLIGLSDCYFAKANGVAILHYEDVSLENLLEILPFREKLLNPILDDTSDISAHGWNHSVILTDDMRFALHTNFSEQVVDFKYFVGMDFNKNDNTKYNNKDLYPVQTLPLLKSHYTPVMDNITFMLPPVPVLSQPEDMDYSWFCNRSTLPDPDYCFSQDLCMCTHLLRVHLNQVVELIVFHEGRVFSENGHSIHLHGHSFHLLGLGKIGSSLSRADLENLENNGHLRRNFIQPPVRDTVNVPDGGYAILRFKANNPGYWFFHCHTDSHLQQGMALLIQVGDHSNLPPLPADFPRCGGMGFSNALRWPCPDNLSAGANKVVIFFSIHLVSLVIIML
ncbi:laccase-2-like [Pomacea canaliculata]|uniref:laccase-2-like n=1 Tax=Pomacea canaliculata TaxID=400727 RepID=UPI000D726125|nr:laccase-2-like [Pomacea canaliculata]